MATKCERELAASKRQMLAGSDARQRKLHLEFWNEYEPRLRVVADRLQFWRTCGNRRCRRNHACRGEAQMCTRICPQRLPDPTRLWIKELNAGFKQCLSVRKARRAATRAVRAKAAAAQAHGAGGTAPASTMAPPSGPAV